MDRKKSVNISDEMQTRINKILITKIGKEQRVIRESEIIREALQIGIEELERRETNGKLVGH